MRNWLKDHGLGVVTALLFVAFLIGTFFSGLLNYNEDQVEHGQPAVSVGEYLVSPNFGEAVFENWESEFLQMGMLIVLTIFLFQRGSAESKPVGEETEQDKDPRSARWYRGGSLGVSHHVPLLVRVVPELAERVPGGVADGRRHRVPAPTRLGGIQAGAHPAPRNQLLTISVQQRISVTLASRAFGARGAQFCAGTVKETPTFAR